MRLRLKDLKKIIREEAATIDSDVIAQTVMDVLSDEGGAAGIDPIEDALEDLEGEDEVLPDTDLEELILAVPGVKQHKDGDYVDSTELSESRFRRKSLKITKSTLRRIIRESYRQIINE